MLKLKILLVSALFFLLCSCDQPATIKPQNNLQLLAQALTDKDSNRATILKQQVRISENTQNLIGLYLMLNQDSITLVEKRIEYVQQFNPQMNSLQKNILNELTAWTYLKQIYRQEVSPPVRILQRERLYLAPSEINFKLCPGNSPKCASVIRKRMTALMTDDEIKNSLRKMASRDPCVNLSFTLKGEEIANKCLKKSKGKLQVNLLPIPKFSYEQWLQVLNSGS
jgi:hypothetical protein